MAFKRLSDAQNYSFRMSARTGEKKYEEFFSGRISRENGAVWGMLDVITRGPPTVTIVTKGGRGVLEVESQWMTLEDIFIEHGHPEDLKFPRQGMRTVFNVLKGNGTNFRPCVVGMSVRKRLLENPARPVT